MPRAGERHTIENIPSKEALFQIIAGGQIGKTIRIPRAANNAQTKTGGFVLPPVFYKKT